MADTAPWPHPAALEPAGIAAAVEPPAAAPAERTSASVDRATDCLRGLPCDATPFDVAREALRDVARHGTRRPGPPAWT